MRLLWVFLLTTAVLIKNIEGSGGKSSWEGGNSWKGGKGWKGGKDHWKGGKSWKGGSWKGGKASPLEACPKDVVDTAASTPGFKTLVKLVKDFDLVDTLKKANAVTIFAPTDDAFDKLPPGTLKKLTKQEAKEVLLTHVVGATLPAEAVGPVVEGHVKTLSGKKIDLKKKGDKVVVKCEEAGVKAHVEEADVFARNGVIHAIDKVLIKAKKEETYN